MPQMVKNLPEMLETWAQSLGREDPLEKGGSPLQCSCLENPMDGGASRATVHGVPRSRTRLSEHTDWLGLSHVPIIELRVRLST